MNVSQSCVTEAKGRQLPTVGCGGLPCQLAPPSAAQPASAPLQLVAMGRILLPPGRIRHGAPVAQQIRVPVLATTDAAILRLESPNAAFHLVVRARKVLPVVALHQVRAQIGEDLQELVE